jgi:hypothetical protein
MAKKRTPQELARIKARKEFVQSKPDLDPAKARQQFFVQTRVKELEKSGAEVTKERKAALRQKFASGNVQRAGFYTPADVAKFTGNNKTTPTPTPTVTQTSGYVSPSPSGGTRNSGIKPVTVQKTSSKSKGTGFKQLGKDILSGAASAKRNIDLFIDEATGSAAIQRAMDNKSAPLKNRIGEGLLGVVTGIANVSGVGYLSTSIRGAKNTATTVINTTRALPKGKQTLGLPSGKNALNTFELPAGPRVIDRVFDMPPAPAPAVRARAPRGTRTSGGTRSTRSTRNTRSARTTRVTQEDVQLANYADRPVAGTTINLGRPGQAGNPPFRQSAQPSTSKTIEWVRGSTSQAPVPQSLAEVKAVVTPKAVAKPAASTPARTPFRTVFKSQQEFVSYWTGGGKSAYNAAPPSLKQSFINQNKRYLDAFNRQTAGQAAKAKIEAAAQKAAVIERNAAEGFVKTVVPKSQQALRQPVKRKPAVKKAPIKKLSKSNKTKAK